MPKGTSKRESFLLILLFSLAAFVRFYRFPSRIVYGPEQAISLLTSANYLGEKISLLGQPDLIRSTSAGHVIFQNALFNYSLVPLQLLFRHDPILITAYFALLNLFTGLVIYLLIKKRHGSSLAFLTTAFFLFSSTMIYHSLFIWILNYLPLLGILLYFCLTRKNKFTLSNIFLIGLLCGASFALEYAFIFIAFAIFVFIIWRSPHKIPSALIFLLGAIIPNLTLVIFDLKHQFFHTLTFWQFTLDIFSGKGQTKLSYYHFLSFWPILCLLAAYLVQKYVHHRFLLPLLLSVYLFINLSSGKVSILSNPNKPPYPQYSDFSSAAKLIAQDKTNSFNVATLFDFDTQAHTLRYLLQYRYGQKPQPVENYASIDALYVFSPKSYDIQSPKVWELQTFFPYTITVLDTKSDFILYKLTK